MENSGRIIQLINKLEENRASIDSSVLSKEDIDFIITSLESWEEVKKEIGDRSQARAYSDYQFGENHGLTVAEEIIDKFLLGENKLLTANSSITWTSDPQADGNLSFY